MSDTFNCPVWKCGPMITDYCLSCSRIEGNATSDQLREAQVKVLREAAENVTIWIKELDADDRYYVREQLARMADELEKQ